MITHGSGGERVNDKSNGYSVVSRLVCVYWGKQARQTLVAFIRATAGFTLPSLRSAIYLYFHKVSNVQQLFWDGPYVINRNVLLYIYVNTYIAINLIMNLCNCLLVTDIHIYYINCFRTFVF